MECSFYLRIILFIGLLGPIILLPLQSAKCETATPGIYSGSFTYDAWDSGYGEINGLFGIFISNLVPKFSRSSHFVLSSFLSNTVSIQFWVFHVLLAIAKT